MALIVQKFGGTSVGSLQRIAAVADRIAAAVEAQHQIVVVLSAMAGETDRLETMAYALAERPMARELDMLLATGEQVTIALLAIALCQRGVDACSYAGHQVHILTDSVHNKALIREVNGQRLHAELQAGRVVIVAGFQGVDEQGNITTLGRGGSDTTAVAVAAALGAEECHIFTDVDGVYTTDPRIEPKARRLSCLTYEEMLEHSSLGAKVLQIRAVEFAARYKVPVRVLSSFAGGAGTLICSEDTDMEKPVVSGIAFNRDEAKVTLRDIPDKPGVAATILQSVAARHIDVDMIIQNAAANGMTDFTFTVHQKDLDGAIDALNSVRSELEAGDISSDTAIAKISLVGIGMRSNVGVASTMFATLAEEGVNIQLISTSEIKVSVVVDEKYLELTVRALHAVFALDSENIEPQSEADALAASDPSRK